MRVIYFENYANGCNKVGITAYRPSTNGMVERYHRTLNSILVKVVKDDQRNWCEKVPIATAAYRASVHEATGYTPNRLMLNRSHLLISSLDHLQEMRIDTRALTTSSRNNSR